MSLVETVRRIGMKTSSSTSVSELGEPSCCTPSEEVSNNTNMSPSIMESQEDPSATVDDIAVIGLGCRVPGGNNSPSQLWNFLLNKQCASGDIPSMRWEPYFKRHHCNANILSKTTSKGYFLDRLEDFDATFFGICPREAEQIDPQQRIAVEVTWEALEHAGIPPQTLAGSDTAVFIGVNSDDYSRLLLEDLPGIEAWMGVGTAFCGIPNRISYLLDLMGPSCAVDAACASSLVAIHHARQALISGETSLAIAGGVNALVGPGLPRVLDKAGAISADGRCRSFDDDAAGYGRGEGAGIVILKRMADALQDQDRILAVLKGSAVGADGRTNGIMAPNQIAQERVARQALKAAGVAANSISYIEAHATSTPIGDPTECSAMANVYGSGARLPGSEPCLIGSIKPNIGHLEAGAGVLGFIKAVLALHSGTIPPQANLKTPNTKIDWEKSLLKVVTEPTKWPTNCGPRRAAVASYGYGGTVSHAILEEAPPSRSVKKLSSKLTDTSKPTLLLLSAPQAPRIATTAGKLARWLEATGGHISLDSVAFTLATKRGHHNYRAAIVVENALEAVSLLDTLSHQSNNPWLFSHRTLPKNVNNGAVWVFSGHGAQWKAMGRSLLQSEPSFMDIVGQLEPIIQEEMGFSALQAFEDEDFDTTDRIQVLTYVMHVGIAAVLKAKGIVPRAVIGHSMGEIAASVVVGALTLHEGALIVCVRARLYRSVAGTGAMVVVSKTYNDAVKELSNRDDIAAAIDSSPNSCVVSGSVKAVEEFSEACKLKGLEVRVVKSDVAFHSPVLSSLVPRLRKLLIGRIIPKEAQIPLYSTSLTGNPRVKNAQDVDYWVNNMVKPVLLTSAVAAATEDGFRIFLEVSSHPIVSHCIQETLMEANISDSIVIPTMFRNKEAEKSLLLALGKLHCVGSSIDFQKLLRGSWLHDLPGTIWDHQSYWRSVGPNSVERKVSHDVKSHDLLGSRTQICGSNDVLWQTYLDDTVKPYPGSHFLHETEIVPAAVLLNTFISAAPSRSLQNVSLRVPVVIGPPREVQVLLQHSQVRISSRLIAQHEVEQDNQSWLINTTTELSLIDNRLSVDKVDLIEIRKRLHTSLKPTFSIEYLANVGVPDMGFPWKVLEHSENETEMLAKVDVNPEAGLTLPWTETSWAPILDAATSVSSTIFYKEPMLRMPTSIHRIIISSSRLIPKIAYLCIKKAAIPFATDVLICSEDGSVTAEIQSMKFVGIDGNPSGNRDNGGLVYQLAWPPALLAEIPYAFQHVVFIANETPSLQNYRDHLSKYKIGTETISSPENLRLNMKDTIVIFIPDEAKSMNDVPQISSRSCEILLGAVKTLVKMSPVTKIFCLTQSVFKGETLTALSHAPLHGLARIIHSEHPDVWGGLIDVEDSIFPFQAIKYVQDADVIRVDDFVARTARLRSFPIEKVSQSSKYGAFHLRLDGTYIITGGLGALGLEVATWLAEKGARRLVLISRRSLPPRTEWKSHKNHSIIQSILGLEAIGVTVYAIAVDMSASNAASQLRNALDRLALPPVLGVVHAAGVLEDQLVLSTTRDSFDRVIAPKIIGAMALNELFPPKSLDFFVLFSSCGQLLGFPGQAAYASGNAFLDCLATHRRNLGDNTVSMMWTSWRGLGMAASTEYINAELEARGITDITRDEAFQAWEQIAMYDTDHAVILRPLPIGMGEPSPHPVLNDILVRRRETSTLQFSHSKPEDEIPKSGPELEEFLMKVIIESVASTLSLSPTLVDIHTALPELGMDSVMTVGFRNKLQQTLKIKVSSTLVWRCPTVNHLVKYFQEMLRK